VLTRRQRRNALSAITIAARAVAAPPRANGRSAPLLAASSVVRVPEPPAGAPEPFTAPPDGEALAIGEKREPGVPLGVGWGFVVFWATGVSETLGEASAVWVGAAVGLGLADRVVGAGVGVGVGVGVGRLRQMENGPGQQWLRGCRQAAWYSVALQSAHQALAPHVLPHDTPSERAPQVLLQPVPSACADAEMTVVLSADTVAACAVVETVSSPAVAASTDMLAALVSRRRVTTMPLPQTQRDACARGFSRAECVICHDKTCYVIFL